MIPYFKQRPGMGSNMMQSYMERQLGSIHDASAPAWSNYKDKIIAFLSGAFVLIVLPYIHIGKYSVVWLRLQD